MKHYDCDTLHAEMQHLIFYSDLFYQDIHKQQEI